MRRKTTGTGRMRYMKDLTRRFKNGFREGAQSLIFSILEITAIIGKPEVSARTQVSTKSAAEFGCCLICGLGHCSRRPPGYTCEL